MAFTKRRQKPPASDVVDATVTNIEMADEMRPEEKGDGADEMLTEETSGFAGWLSVVAFASIALLLLCMAFVICYCFLRQCNVTNHISM